MSTGPKLNAGEVFEGRYRVIEPIGKGAFAHVYRAEQLGMEREVALKVLKLDEDGQIDESRKLRFRREAKLLSTLTHPNTLTVFDFGHAEDGRPFLVSEYVPGKTLKALLADEGSLVVPRAVRILHQVLGSLYEAHARGIIHRDIKPDNIMVFDRVGDKDVAKLLDFGIGKFVGQEGTHTLTHRGEIVGTPSYMAPELLTGQALSPATDIYATGLTFYEMLSGRRAVTGATKLQIIAKQTIDRPVIDADDLRIPDELRELIARMTAKSLDVRYPNVDAVQNALGAIDLSGLAGWRPPRLEEDDPFVDNVSPEIAARRARALAELESPVVAADDTTDSMPVVEEIREDRVPPEQRKSPWRAPPTVAPPPLPDDDLDDLDVSGTPGRNMLLAGAVVVCLVILGGLLVGLVTLLSATGGEEHSAEAAVARDVVEGPAEQGESPRAPSGEDLALLAPEEEPNATPDNDPVPTRVELSSEPEGAEVYRGDKKIGRTPLMVELTEGVNQLSLTKEGFTTKQVTMETGSPSMVVELEPTVTKPRPRSRRKAGPRGRRDPRPAARPDKPPTEKKKSRFKAF